jgi:hypothetical protein
VATAWHSLPQAAAAAPLAKAEQSEQAAERADLATTPAPTEDPAAKAPQDYRGQGVKPRTDPAAPAVKAAPNPAGRTTECPDKTATQS